jgi:GAF domain-containing protein
MRSVALLATTQQVLEMVAAGASLRDILGTLCAAIDAQSSDMMSMVMLMDPDRQRLWPAAGARVPIGWTRAISPLMIGQNMGSCGAAAFRGERVIVSNVATDPLWSAPLATGSREVALEQGIRACWSQPIMSKDDVVLGTVSMYFAAPRTPTSADLQLLEDAAHVAGMAIEEERSRSAERRI